MDNKARLSNNFDFLRLVAALLVIFSHSFPLSGNAFEPMGWLTGYGTFGMLGVIIFFTISGYLITKSWVEHPSVARFLWNRFLRIFPGLFVVTALGILVLGPLATTLPLREYFAQVNVLVLYLKNATLLSISYHLPGVFADNPFKDAVNGSLWTLPVEFGLYLAVMALGLLGLLQKKEVYLALTVSAMVLYASTRMPGVVILQNVVGLFDATGLRGFLMLFSSVINLMFLIGGLFYLYRDKIPLNGAVALALLAVQCAASRTPYFEPLCFICMPYIILFLAQMPTKRLRNIGKYGDFSYGLYIYAFPVQQLIVHFARGIDWLGLFALSAPVAFVFAFLSWHLVEARALGLKKINPVQAFSNYWEKIHSKSA